MLKVLDKKINDPEYAIDILNNNDDFSEQILSFIFDWEETFN